jgi:hypothetical protein
MAITAEQAAQLASAYQSGNSGLQSLVNQMGVTQADVQQYFPGFDVAGAGLTLPSVATSGSPFATTSAPTPPPPPIDFSSFGLGRGAQSQLEKLSNIINTGGTLTASQESRLGRLSQKTGQDLADFFNYTPVSEKYRYTPTTTAVEPTYGTQGLSGDVITDFIEANLDRPELIAQKAQEFGISSGDITAATGYTPQEQADYFQAFKMLPTTSAYDYDLFPELGVSQEKKLEKLVNLLALGQELTPGQAKQLTKLGAKTGYDFFNVPTYQSLEEQLGERAKGTTFQSIVDYIGQNIDDPTKIYQRATELGISPEDVLLAYSATEKKGKSPYSLEQIQEYFETGKGGYETTFDTLLSSTFGESNVASAKNLFKPEDFSNKSVETILETLQNSPQNKAQDALTLANALGKIYGYDQTQTLSLAKDLVSGKIDDQTITSIYGDLLKTNTFDSDAQGRLLTHIADTNPDAYIFQQNPDLLTFYKPIGDLITAPKDSGQYGYYKNAPILSAEVADRILGDNLFIGGNNALGYGSQGRIDDDLGWDLRSKYQGFIANGAGVFGVQATSNQIDEFTRIQQQIDALGGVKDGYVAVERTDPETNQKYIANVPVETLFATEVDSEGGSNGGQNYKLYQDTIAALNRGAAQLNIDPSKFSTPSELFDAVQGASENLYIVQGRANNWDAEPAEAAGITGVGRDRGGKNHATVMYQKVGEKLIPVQTLKVFNFDDPNTSRGFFGDLFQGIASLPFVAELALLNPATASFYPLIKGAQTAALGGDFEDVFKSAGLAYLTTNFIPKTLGPMIQTELATSGIVSNLAQNNPGLANFITKAGSNAIISMGMAELTGQDPFDAATSSLLSSGIFASTNAGLKFTDAIPDQYKTIVANMITDLILNQDPKRSLANLAKTTMNNEIKDFMKTREVLTDERSPTTQV